MNNTTTTWRVPLVAAAVALVALTAGCAGLTAEASLEYDGASNGSHSEKADCDASGSVSGSGDITDGQVHVTVTDAEGNALFERTYSEAFDLSETSLDGHAGTWTIEATRGGDDVLGDQFNGDYEFHLDCASAL